MNIHIKLKNINCARARKKVFNTFSSFFWFIRKVYFYLSSHSANSSLELLNAALERVGEVRRSDYLCAAFEHPIRSPHRRGAVRNYALSVLSRVGQILNENNFSKAQAAPKHMIYRAGDFSLVQHNVFIGYQRTTLNLNCFFPLSLAHNSTNLYSLVRLMSNLLSSRCIKIIKSSHCRPKAITIFQSIPNAIDTRVRICRQNIIAIFSGKCVEKRSNALVQFDSFIYVAGGAFKLKVERLQCLSPNSFDSQGDMIKASPKATLNR